MDAVVLVVNNEGAEGLDVAAVAVLARANAVLAGGPALLDVGVDTEGLEELDGVLGLLDLLGTVIDDDGDLGNLADGVSASLDEGREG